MLTDWHLRNPALFDKVVSPEAAALLIEDGMTIGTSGFTPQGFPKLVPSALAKQVAGGRKVRLTLASGASNGAACDDELAKVGAVACRLPFYARAMKNMRAGIDKREIEFMDLHLSHTAEEYIADFHGHMDVAIVEALAITENGDLILTTGVGNTPAYVACADKVIVELNTAQPKELEGIHDIYLQQRPPHRSILQIERPEDRIGTPYVKCGLDKIAAIVESNVLDKVIPMKEPDEKSRRIANNLINFWKSEIVAGRLPQNLLPMQSGVGAIANAVLYCLKDSGFKDLVMYSEILQPSVIDLIDAGIVRLASGCAFNTTPSVYERFRANPNFYRDKIILRPLDISNSGEVIHRLGCIACNTAVEVDIYGHENSTHVNGSKMLNGIGGSNDYMRNAYLSIFLTESTADNDNISRVVPVCSHVDNTEHDMMVFITEYGVADLRHKSPVQRAREIINNCAHPDFRPMLTDYLERAISQTGGHEPHILQEALSWHIRYQETGSMKPLSKGA